MGTKTSPGNFDCFSNALDDEPMFVLLARDRHFRSAVEKWADERELELYRGFVGDKRKFQEEMLQLQEARDCAKEGEAWRSQNMGVWKGATPNREVAPIEVGMLAELPAMLTPEEADEEYERNMEQEADSDVSTMLDHYNLDGMRA